MKTLKILFYICFGICLIQLLAYLFGPFGGPESILISIKAAGSNITLEDGHVISFDWPPYSDNPATKYIHILGSSIIGIYYISLIVCSLLPLFYNMNLKRKYILGVTVCIMGILVSIIGNLIWRHLVKVYLGI